jgi:hypothetical protein
MAPPGDVWSISSNEAEIIRESSTYKSDAHTMRAPKIFNISIHSQNEINIYKQHLHNEISKV